MSCEGRLKIAGKYSRPAASVIINMVMENISRAWRNRLLTLLLIVAGLRFWKTEASYRERKQFVEARDLLATNVGDIDLDDVPFEESLQRLAQRSGVPIVLNRYAAMAEGVPENAPVRQKLRGVDLNRALRAVILSASAGAGRLEFCPVDGVILVSSLRDCDQRAMVARMYAVKPILAAIDEGDAWLKQLLANGSPMANATDTRDYDMGVRLTKLVQNNVAQGRWYPNGPSVEFEFGRLWVTHTPEVHSAIEIALHIFWSYYQKNLR